MPFYWGEATVDGWHWPSTALTNRGRDVPAIHQSQGMGWGDHHSIFPDSETLEMQP